MKKLLLSVFLFAAISASAQWVNQALGVTPPQLVFELEAINDSVFWAAATDSLSDPGQAFYKTTDAGLTWSSGNVGGPPDLFITNITAVDGNTAWVCMVDDWNGGGIVKKTTNGGATWTELTGVSFTGQFSYPTVIHFFDANNGVVAGDPNGPSYEFYRTTDGGQTWTPVSNLPPAIPGEDYLSFAKASHGDTLWIGAFNGKILRTIDKGLTWTEVITHLDMIQALAFTDNLNGMALDYFAQIAITSDGGNIWTPVTPTGYVFDYDLAAVPGVPGMFVTTGWGSFDYPGSSYTLDNGTTWNIIDSVPHMAVAFSSPYTGLTSGYYGGQSGSIFRWSPSVVTKLEKEAEPKLMIYPNPSNGNFNIYTNDDFERIIMKDINGREIYSQPFAGNSHSVELSTNAAKGMYYLLLVNDKKVVTRKVVLD